MKAKLGMAAWLGWFALAGAVRAQVPAWHLDSTYQPPRVQIDLTPLATRDLPVADPNPAQRTTRVRMFGMPTGFLSNPLGLADDEASANAAVAAPTSVFSPSSSDDYSYLQVNFGNHNPYLDLRRPGDPGGVGYYRLYSQLQVVDVGCTKVSLGFNAYTPAGFDSGGLLNGPSYVSPNVAWYHDLVDGVALQGYVGQNISTQPGWESHLGSNLHGGMAIQYALPGTEPIASQGCYLFVQALARYRYDSGGLPTNNSPLMIWDFVPGVHFRWSDNCWMSVGVSRYQFLTCAWQY
jgi:hypothetical protein